MLGHSHALSGAVTGMAAGILLHMPAPDIAALAGYTAGFATFPDLDACHTGPARCLGPLSEGLAWIIGRLSGGHRHLTHSLAGAGAFTGLAWLACHFRHDDAGKAGLLLMLSLAFAAALWALRVADGLRGELLAVAAAAAVTLTGTGLALVPLACLLGVTAHIAGDAATVSGVPLAYPFLGARHRFRWWPSPLAFTTGTRPETCIVDPLLTAALAILAVRAADPSLERLAWAFLRHAASWL